jgi:NAD(P)-dependent dehydrogenase (short-subunit alcohol dehydrogenase family)
MGRVNGKVALVTGAGSGIGRGCAMALGREGAAVIVTDVEEEGARETSRAIIEGGGKAKALRLDVADEGAWATTIETTRQSWGALHILVNNAAICIRAPLLEMSLETWRRQIAINLDGVFLGAKTALPLIAASGGGVIVNMSSVAGLKGVSGLSGYCATKGGVTLFTKALALECAEAHNQVRVNVIHPGSIETPIWLKMTNAGDMPSEGAAALGQAIEAVRAAGAAATPLGFNGEPDDIAEGVLYLCSDAARFVTGASLVIDGGVLAG